MIIKPHLIFCFEQIKEEIASKPIGLKHGLDNIRHNEDYHLVYAQFFQAVRNVAPNSVRHMIGSLLSSAKRKGRIKRSSLRLLFDIFLHLQEKGLLWPSNVSRLHYQVNTIVPTRSCSHVFPDRVDWVEFLDFVNKVCISELIVVDDNDDHSCSCDQSSFSFSDSKV